MLAIFLKVLKFIILVPLEVTFAGVTIMFLITLVQNGGALIGAGVYRWRYIFKELFTALFAGGIAFLLLRALMSEKLKKIPYSKIITLIFGFAFAAAAFTALDENIIDDFDYRSYPSYILEWDTQVITETVDCDYTQDRIYLSGYFNFIDGGFREYANVDLVLKEDCTQSYGVEIRYKGKKGELYIHHDDYRANKDIYVDSISIWPEDYDYEMSPEDIVYMYKHKEDLRYAEPLAIEKITIYTAYPEKFDLSQINV